MFVLPSPSTIHPFSSLKQRTESYAWYRTTATSHSYTICDQYPFLLISDLITDLCSAFIFTKLDIQWGYNNIHIKEGDEHKAVFKTHYGLYKPTLYFKPEKCNFHVPSIDYLG